MTIDKLYVPFLEIKNQKIFCCSFMLSSSDSTVIIVNTSPLVALCISQGVGK